MLIRKYRNSDCDAVSELFYETVHTINARDYTKEQIFAWANDAGVLKKRSGDLSEQYTLVAESDGFVIGFGSMVQTGELDLLFVHKDYQRQGIATALCNKLEDGFSVIKTYASVTAKPFFEKRGYAVVCAREVERRGVRMINYEMQKGNK